MLLSMEKYILALDQGTTSSRALIFDREGRVIASAQQEFKQLFPQPGWVEHDPYDILESQLSAVRSVLAAGRLDSRALAAIGLTNQRETVILWEKETGKPVYNAIVWQCRRTAELCEILRAGGWDKEIRSRTGLIIDPYFSATKISWLLDHVEGLRSKAEQGKVLFGTVDSWLLYNLIGKHITDYSNASRTMLFNIHKGQWDADILKELQIPAALLPEVVLSSGIIGTVKHDLFPVSVPVAGIAGDQQAALFGQGCLQPGEVKNTYGTGCFALLNTGTRAVQSANNLLTTIAWNTGTGIVYALEGAVFVAGAVVQWLRDQIQIISSAEETEALAFAEKNTGGVCFVPAFTGLGAPYWDAGARGLITGITRGTTRAQIVRAALESIAFQTCDLFAAMERDTGNRICALKVDGGASRNNFLMQFQADILGIEIIRPALTESTAFGAACLAGLAVGFWNNPGEIHAKIEQERVFIPGISDQKRAELLAGWEIAVKMSLKRGV